MLYKAFHSPCKEVDEAGLEEPSQKWFRGVWLDGKAQVK